MGVGPLILDKMLQLTWPMPSMVQKGSPVLPPWCPKGFLCMCFSGSFTGSSIASKSASCMRQATSASNHEGACKPCLL